MSQTHDTRDAHDAPADTPDTSEIVINTNADFAPLIDTDMDTDDFSVTRISPPSLYAARRRRRRLLTLLIVFVVLVALIGGGIFAYMQANRPKPVTYTQSAATIGNIAVTVSATGPLEPQAIYDMNFTASGQIQAIYVHVGQQVAAGQKLATLNSTSLQDAVNQAQQSLNSATNSVGTAEANLANTKNQEANALNIAYINEQNALNACTTTSGGGSGPGTPTPTPDPTAVANCQQLAQDQYTQAVDQANSSIASANNQVTSAQQQVNSAQANLQTAQDNLAASTLTAPHAGTIVSINGIVGQTTGSGGSSSSSSSSSSSAFIVLVDASSLSITAAVNEANIAAVNVGQSAHFTVAAYPSLTFRAIVSSIDTLGSTSSSVVTYPVSLAVDMQSLSGAHVYPGMTATVNITTAERIGTLLVPSSALSFINTALQNGELSRSSLSGLTSSGATGSGNSQGSRGIVVELKNGKLVPVLVTTGLTNGQFTEILSGLSEGTSVVVGQTGGTTTTSSSTGTGTGGTGGGIRLGGGGLGGGGGFVGGGGGNGG